jgi:hypothetical protein
VSLPALIMWAVVVGVGVPAAFRNWTALALCWAWLISELLWRLTGENLPVGAYFILDYAVLLVIFTKPETRDFSPYRSFTDQVRALWREHSPSDVIIAAIFPLMWIVYVADIGDFYRWWVLWGLVQLQFFAAGWEAFCLAWADRKVSGAKPPGLFKLGLAGHG